MDPRRMNSRPNAVGRERMITRALKQERAEAETGRRVVADLLQKPCKSGSFRFEVKFALHMKSLCSASRNEDQWGGRGKCCSGPKGAEP
jgi:hypothetical protein